MSTLQQFLTDILGAVDPFKDVILRIMMLERDGHIHAAAQAKDGSFSIQIKSKTPIDGFRAKACLGSLPYLRSGLASKNMANGELELTYGQSGASNEDVLRSIKLKGANRFSQFYQAIDPFVNQLNRIKLPATIDWPVAFGIDGNFISNFDDSVRVISAAEKMGSERDDIFMLSLVNGGIEGVFGERTHTITVQLTGIVETSLEDSDTLNAHFNISRFKSLLRLIGKGEGIGYLSSKSLKVDIETDHAEYQYTVSAKKVLTRT